VVRPARFERATFSSGGENEKPTTLRAAQRRQINELAPGVGLTAVKTRRKHAESRANPIQLQRFSRHRETPAVCASTKRAAAQIVSMSWAESRVSGCSSV
jgi:hypothetical protein